MVVYFDNISIYNWYEINQVGHLRKVLKDFLENKLYMNLKMYSLMTNKLLFLSFFCEYRLHISWWREC